MNQTDAIIAALRSGGLDACYPAEREGVCTAPYCVVRRLSGSLTNRRSGYARYCVIVLVPSHLPGCLETTARRVIDALAPLVSDGSIALTQPGGAVVVDDRFRALTATIEYVSYFDMN